MCGGIAGETTAVGEPRPTAAGRVQQQQPSPIEQQLQGAGLGLGRLVAMGEVVGVLTHRSSARQTRSWLLVVNIYAQSADRRAVLINSYTNARTGAGVGLAFGLIGKLFGG